MKSFLLSSQLSSWTPKLLLTALIAGFLFLPFALGHAVQRGANPAWTGCSAPADLVWAERLRSAWELESDGNLEEAKKEYAAAISSPSDCARKAGVAGSERISAIRARLGVTYRTIAELAAVSVRARTPIVSAIFLLAIGWIAIASAPRRGSRIADFPVYGCSDPAAGKLFRDALIWFANEIKHVYGSEYARTRGITLLFDDLKGTELGAQSAYEQALEEAKDPEATAAVRFALSRFIQFLRDATGRPQFVIEGTVGLFPGCAKVVGLITDRATRREIRIEAVSTEIDEIPGARFVQQRLLNPAPPPPPAFSAPREAGEMRELSGQLFALALVLACKIRFEQSEALTIGYKPNSWKTVCLFAAAALTLE